MIFFVLACTAPKSPALYPEPFARYTPAATYPDDGPRPAIVGDPPQLCTTPEDWARLKGRSQELRLHERALDACYAGRELDRALSQDAYDRLTEAHAASEAERRGLRAAVPLAGLLGGLVGAGLAVGIAWGLPR